MWHRLGIRTLIIYIIKGLLPGLFLMIVSFIILGLKNYILNNPDLNLIQTPDLESLILGISGVAALASFPIMALGIIINILRYFSFKYKMEEDAFKYHKGLISVDEASIPYIKIETVDFDQSIFGRIIGVAHLSITTAGAEELDKYNADTGVVINMIDTSKARHIQKELISKGSIQKVKAV